MRTKRVNRYYCDFCKKSGCSAAAMAKHEKHCTMNPRRTCRMCEYCRCASGTLPVLMALLPDPAKYTTTENDYESISGQLTTDANRVLDDVREAADHCPVCVMAAIRQRGIRVGMVTDFRFSKECEEALRDANEQADRDEYDAMVATTY